MTGRKKVLKKPKVITALIEEEEYKELVELSLKGITYRQVIRNGLEVLRGKGMI
jgi:hypothetical protein